MLKRLFADGKNREEKNSPEWIFDGTPVRRLWGMVYWYSWGEHIFDIRDMRKLLGLPKYKPEDKYYTWEKKDPIGSFNAIMKEIQDAIDSKGLNFSEVMRQHDLEMDVPPDLAGKREPESRPVDKDGYEITQHWNDDTIPVEKKITFKRYMKICWENSRTNLHYIDFCNKHGESMKNMFKPVGLQK